MDCSVMFLGSLTFFHLLIFALGGFGSWCPYKVETLIECKVRNGSEFYMSPHPMCSPNGKDGSLTCMQRVIRRPKYVTTVKKVNQTKYKCCPFFTGPDCESECFNCSSIKSMETRLDVLEARNTCITPPLSIPPKSTPTPHPEQQRSDEPAHVLDNIIPRVLHKIRSLELRLEILERELAGLKRPVPRSAGPEYSVQDPGERMLENNLGRGDIASTLNDDYGEDRVAGLEYEDQLHH